MSTGIEDNIIGTKKVNHNLENGGIGVACFKRMKKNKNKIAQVGIIQYCYCLMNYRYVLAWYCNYSGYFIK